MVFTTHWHTRPRAKHVLVGGVAVGVTLLCLTVVAALYVKHQAYQTAYQGPPAPAPDARAIVPFPVGVDVTTETIVEQALVDSFFSNHLAATQRARLPEATWWQRVVKELATQAWWQTLASPSTRILVIWPGERKEQIIDNFGDILGWTAAERRTFASAVASSSVALTEGIYHPGSYVVPYDAGPETVADLVMERFENEVAVRYTDAVARQVPLKDALTIASLLERESYDFNEMRTIAGVIWNRLFIDMPLQLDASLQYVKGSRPTGPWWPRVRPADKFLESPFNTYENVGLPPQPISNPSAATILAALNPRQTECLFYFHDSRGGFYCSETYEEHVERLRAVYGQGK